MKIYGHIGEREIDSGEWLSFDFEVLDQQGDHHTVHIPNEDLGDLDWQTLFDWLETFADEQDVDYENSYGEAT